MNPDDKLAQFRALLARSVAQEQDLAVCMAEAEAIRQWACKAFEAAYSRDLQRDFEKD